MFLEKAGSFEKENVNSFLRNLLLFSVSTVIYSNTVSGDFVYDDRAAICDNEDVTGQSLLSFLFNDFWGNDIRSPGSHKSWRPLTTLTFRINYILFGLSPIAFHATNIILHGIASLLVFHTGSWITGKSSTAFSSALLFAVHPIHTEAVANIVGRSDILVTIFTLLSLLDFHKNQNVLRVLCWTILAVTSKESGAVLPFLHIVQLSFYGKPEKNTIKNKSCLLLAIGLVIAFIRLVINNFQSPHFAKSSNPLPYEKNNFKRIFTLLYLPVFNLRLLLFPNKLSFDWSLEYLCPIDRLLDYRVTIICLFYTILFFLSIHILLRIISSIYPSILSSIISSIIQKNDKIGSDVFFYISISILSFLPASNLFVYVGFVVAERILYLPSIGFCYVFSRLFEELEQGILRCREIRNCLFVAILFLCAQRTVNRNEDWINGEALYRSGKEISPAKALTNLGRELSDNPSRRVEALQAYTDALHIKPNMADTWYNLALLYVDDGNLKKAESCYRQAIHFRKYFTQAHLNLGLLLWKQQKVENSIEILQKCTNIDGKETKNQKQHVKAQLNCWLQLARIYQSLGHLNKALSCLKQVPDINISNIKLLINVYNLYGEIYAGLGDLTTADKYYQKALSVQPENESTFLNMAFLRIKQNRSKEAEMILNEMEKFNFSSHVMMYNKALMHIKLGNVKTAEQLLNQNLRINPNHLESMNTLAFLLKDQNRIYESEKLLRRAVQLMPMSSSSCSNYGAILHMIGKLEEAEFYYLKAIQLNSSDNIAVQNLQKLRRILNRRQKT